MKVYLSSTLEDLRDYRDKAYRQLRKMRHDVLSMEDYVAAHERPLAKCLADVASSDAYIGVFAWRYGFIPDHDNLDRRSITELEYLQAIASGKRCQIFLLRETTPWPAQFRDSHTGEGDCGKSIQRLRDELSRHHVVAPFGNPDELASQISASLVPSEQPLPQPRPFMCEPLPRKVVARTTELTTIVTEVRAARERAAAEDGTGHAPMVALSGAGGFGKRTLAIQVCHELKDDFRDGVLWMRLGEEPTEQQLVGKCCDLASKFERPSPTFSDALTAGNHLGDVLGRRNVLLVLEDVWSERDLEPFLCGGPSTVRLVSTCDADVLPAGLESIPVGSLSEEQTRELLGWGLKAEGVDWSPLLKRTGGWPLLVALANGTLRAVAAGGSVTKAVDELAAALAAHGPAVLDPANSDHRRRAVGVSVQNGLKRLAWDLGVDASKRYMELGILSEGGAVPLDLLARWWKLEPVLLRRWASRLQKLSLVREYEPDKATIRMHAVLHAHLRSQLSEEEREPLHAALVAANRPDSGRWADLTHEAEYLWRWAVSHMSEAHLEEEASTTVRDVAFLATKAHLLGPPAVIDDLALVGDPSGQERRSWFRRWSHLVDGLPRPTDVAATLLARPDAPALLDSVDARRLETPYLRYAPGWACPEPASTALVAVLGTHFRRVHTVAWSSEGARVASAGGDGIVRVWSVDDDSHPREVDHGGWIRALTWSPDGQRLACGDDDGRVCLWSVDGGSDTIELGRHAEGIRAVDWSKDGRRIAVGGDDGVRIWAVADESAPSFSISRTGRVRAVAWSPDGHRVACAGDDGIVLLRSAEDGELLEVDRHPGPAYAVAWSPDGQRVVSGGDDGVLRVWSLDGASPLELGEVRSPVLGVAWSPDGTGVASASGDGQVCLWRITGQAAPVQLGRHEGWALAVAWSPDGRRLVSGGRDCEVRLWRAPETSGTAETASRSHRRSLAWSPDGRRLLTGSDDGSVLLWSVDRGTHAELGWHRGAATAVAWSAGGDYVASGGDDGVVRIRSIDASCQSLDLRAPGRSARTLAWSPDGTTLACSGDDGSVRLWRVEVGVGVTDIGRRGESVRSVAWSPEGGSFATGDDDGGVRLWTAEGDRDPVKVGRHEGAVRAVAWYPGGQRLASADEDGHVWLWSADPRREPHRLDIDNRDVRALAWSPDGSKLVTAAGNGRIQVWHTDEPVRGHPVLSCTLAVSGVVKALEWQPGGQLLAAAGSQGLYVLEVVV